MYSKKESRIILICAITIIISVVLIGVIAAINRVNNKFTFKNHLNETVATINYDEKEYKYSMQDISYYILLMEASINYSAELFNPNNLYSLWNIKQNGKFMKDSAKEMTMELFIRDNIYYIEALAANTILTDEEIATVHNEASHIYRNLTGKQVDATELTMEDLYNIRYKINVIVIYISSIMRTHNYTENELDINGTYFNEIYNKYSISVKDIWDDVELGDITITREQDE